MLHWQIFDDLALRQDGLSKNLPIPPMLNIWSLPYVPDLMISAVFILTGIKKCGEYFDLIQSYSRLLFFL